MSGPAPPELSPASDPGADATWVLRERLGDGATSEVWRARRNNGGDDVVLKLARSADMATALAHEALVAVLALSPRLPELVGLGTYDDGRPYIAFRDDAGVAIDAGHTDVDLALRVACDVGEALADLHDVGLAHGDVKPQNVTVSESRAALIDLGLAGPSHRVDVGGATPRYLGRGDRRLGDARARDLLALGILIAELGAPEVAASDEPLLAARAAKLDDRIAPLCTALLAPEPGARPSARWIHHRAAAVLPRAAVSEEGDRHARRVRATYLRMRRFGLARARDAAPHVAAWAADALRHHHAARQMCRAAAQPPPAPLVAEPDELLEPLSPQERRRWLVGLVGPAAASWPPTLIADQPEHELADALVALARELAPRSWTLRDLEAWHPVGRPNRPVDLLDANGAARLALGIARVPTDWAAVEAVELRATTAPIDLALAAADTLRLAGELGRARSVLAAMPHDGSRGLDVAADILRRYGDTERAASVAKRAIEAASDPRGRARACLARMRYDAGAYDDAAKLLEPSPRHAATAEVAALIEAARGDLTAALAVARRGYALAASAEERARLSATIAYIEHGTNAVDALERFRAAADYAVQAGAVLEEASYRTSVAAASVNLGQLASAVVAAERAALLWEEVLDRPGMAARAWLARAAAHAAVDAQHETIYAAEQAISRARECDDERALAYAWWAIADVSVPGSERGARAAARGGEPSASSDDGIQAAARVLRHAPTTLSERLRRDIDGRCRHAAETPAATEARLSWWRARALDLLAVGLDDDARDAASQIIGELCALADADAPVEAAGRAMYAGTLLAAATSESDALSRLEAARAEHATRVHNGASREMAEALRSCAWIAGRGRAPSLEPSHAIDLRQLVLALSERDSLRKLLDRVLDVLILWTGAERGLLLMRTPEATLVPRAARNLGRGDLEREQLQVSTSLAERALESGEPVVAIDAMEELSSSYDSVHALKLRSVLALPLIAHGDVLGVVYLDDRLRRGAFRDKELAWAQSVAPVAALAIADARAQVELRRAAKRAERATRKLEESLARKETALDVAERELARTVHGDATRFRHDDIIGESEPMTKLLRLTDRIAGSDVPVLLLGESGSGKELIARALHRGSTRRANAFVGENCGALPETLLESTLFGHVKGAFTGAHRPRVGLFEAADEGTLFLDEIGEMSLGMQTKLLRVLEDSLVRPVGATRARKVDVRVIAATHRDLEDMVKEGTFRQDLYYRLNVISVRIPPLRERTTDIPLLVEHLIRKHAPGRTVRVTEAAYARLRGHAWPGNVRQLENEVRRALLLAEDTIDAAHLSIEEGEGGTASHHGLDVRKRIDLLEIELVTDAMGRTGGNQTQAAKLLGVSRYGLHKMMKRLGIAPHKKKR